MPTISMTFTGASAADIEFVTLLSIVDIFGNPVSGVALPAAFTETGETWSYTFSGNSTSYNFTYSISDSEATYQPFNGTVTNVAGYQGRYINSTLLNQYLGSVNVAIQSDTNSTGQEDASAVQQVIMAAEDECDSTVAGSPTGLQVPISFGSSPINAALQLRLCQYAGADLYDKRLLTSSTKRIQPPWGKYREEAQKWFKQVWYGDRTLVNAVYNPPQSAITGAIQSVNAAALPILPNGASPWPWGWATAWGGYWWGAGYLWYW
jgi:hypothetical protein